MNKKINRAISSYTLKESGIGNNRYGWFEESSNNWETPPTLTYNEAISFDFKKYHQDIEKFRNSLVKRILKDKKVRAKINACNREDIEEIKTCFGVTHIKFACENYHTKICSKALNMTCINCTYRFNDYEALKNKGGLNEK